MGGTQWGIRGVPKNVFQEAASKRGYPPGYPAGYPKTCFRKEHLNGVPSGMPEDMFQGALAVGGSQEGSAEKTIFKGGPKRAP